MNDIDYQTLSDADIASIVEANRDELHAPDLSTEDILKDLELGHAFIHRSRYGFYIVQKKDTGSAYLWILYVDPAQRGNGIGSDMLYNAITIYASVYVLRLQCHKSLRSFYDKFGFYVYEIEDDTCHMVGPFEEGEFEEWRLYARL